ncbi:hypothetical protein DSL72_005010 [Monilinia vaccinii-corymbosi]|uniref:Uncharacterized protein n=1 Tax=Monilinia vaccinii-corymbosi TaxID=61207 RepID=A0A8A3PE15_9HELO|nr:hypothetical protein DSL72_005010 [Monilinia vaccinii-corymbosi]
MYGFDTGYGHVRQPAFRNDSGDSSGYEMMNEITEIKKSENYSLAASNSSFGGINVQWLNSILLTGRQGNLHTTEYEMAKFEQMQGNCNSPFALRLGLPLYLSTATNILLGDPGTGGAL